MQQHCIYNVLSGYARFLQYFRILSNSFINILAILQDFNGIFLKYSLNITVLCAYLACGFVSLRQAIWRFFSKTSQGVRPSRYNISKSIKYLLVYKNISECWNRNVAVKYFAIFEKNIATIFQLQLKIGNISDMFLQYSVLCGYLVKEFHQLSLSLTCPNSVLRFLTSCIISWLSRDHPWPHTLPNPNFSRCPHRHVYSSRRHFADPLV